MTRSTLITIIIYTLVCMGVFTSQIYQHLYYVEPTGMVKIRITLGVRIFFATAMCLQLAYVSVIKGAISFLTVKVTNKIADSITIDLVGRSTIIGLLLGSVLNWPYFEVIQTKLGRMGYEGALDTTGLIMYAMVFLEVIVASLSFDIPLPLRKRITFSLISNIVWIVIASLFVIFD